MIQGNKDILLRLLQRYHELNVAAGLGGKSYMAAKRYLRQLTEFGYLEVHGGNKNRSYLKQTDL